MHANRRVVVTGLGILSPSGNDIKSAWANLCEGRSGIGPIAQFDATAFATHFAGEVRDFEITDYISRKEARKMDPFIHYGLAASLDALRDSGIEIDERNATRVGVSVAAGIGGIATIEKTRDQFNRGGARKISPFFVPSTIINMISGHLSIITGARGPNLALVTACTTATHNIGLSARLIAYGDADVMVAGGAEHAIAELSLGGFNAARALSTRNDDPQRASRPWDRDRDGFVLSDGAGVLVLEEYQHAQDRGAEIYAELVGFGMSGDAYHMTSPPEGGVGAAQCMSAAIEDASVNPDDIDYINAHGTSTLVGDAAETQAVKSVFGDHASSLVMSSTKSMTGHLLGAAGGVEAIFSTLSLRDQVIPPTINLENPSDGCDLDYAPGCARDAKLDYVLSNSFGFGGTNGSLVFKKME